MDKSKLNPFTYIRAIYEWTLKWAEHKRSEYALGVLSFTESIFFPVPADVLLMVMGAAKPKKALYYGFLTSWTSVLGAVGGYIVGFYLWMAVDSFFFQYVFPQEAFLKVGELYNAEVTEYSRSGDPARAVDCISLRRLIFIGSPPVFQRGYCNR